MIYIKKHEEKGESNMAQNGYIGKIGNTGSMTVKAPIMPTGQKGTSTVKRGNDLRNKGK